MVAVSKILVLPVWALGVAIAPEAGVDAHPRPVTGEVLRVGAGSAPRPGLRTGGLTVVRVQVSCCSPEWFTQPLGYISADFFTSPFTYAGVAK